MCFGSQDVDSWEVTVSGTCMLYRAVIPWIGRTTRSGCPGVASSQCGTYLSDWAADRIRQFWCLVIGTLLEKTLGHGTIGVWIFWKLYQSVPRPLVASVAEKNLPWTKPWYFGRRPWATVASWLKHSWFVTLSKVASLRDGVEDLGTGMAVFGLMWPWHNMLRCD